MPQRPPTFPASYGSYALLKVLSTQGDGPVYLAAVRNQKRPVAIKTMPLRGRGAVDPVLFKAETKQLARMSSPYLAKVQEATQIEDRAGLVMEHVAGRSLAAIRARTEEYSILLPPGLGLIVAHDVWAAAEYFHAFEVGRRVHGNISPRTILVGYSGEVKLTGYRPGVRAPAGADAFLAEDLKPLANLLCELRFEMFPTELTTIVPRLLEDTVSPAEAVAAVRSFLQQHAPSPDQRRAVAAWLEDIFQEHSYAQEVQEEKRLLEAGTEALARSPARLFPKRVTVVGASIAAAVALIGAGAMFSSPSRSKVARSRAPSILSPPPLALQKALPQAQPEPTPPSPAPPEPPPPAIPPVAVLEAPPADLVPAPAKHRAKPPSDRPQANRDTSDALRSDRLLREADEAFDAGRRIQAVRLSIQAIATGGGARAHLALAGYYRSMYRYREALNHYHAAAELEPENEIAATGVRMLEKRRAPSVPCK